jgi:hypothetical protein
VGLFSRRSWSAGRKLIQKRNFSVLRHRPSFSSVNHDSDEESTQDLQKVRPPSDAI